MSFLRYWQVIFLVSVYLFLSQCIIAQTSKTILSGVVTDQSAAVIPNAKIIVEGKDGKRFSSLTNGEGLFELELTEDLYKIEITNPPFTKFVIAEYLVAGANMRLDVALQCKGCEFIEDLLPMPDTIIEAENLKVSNQILNRVKPNSTKAIKKRKRNNK